MLFKTELYSIEYDEKSKSLVQTVNEALNQNFKRILDFWEIQKVENYVEIRIFSDLEEWKKFIVRKIAEKVPREKLIEYALNYTKLYNDWESLGFSE